MMKRWCYLTRMILHTLALILVATTTHSQGTIDTVRLSKAYFDINNISTVFWNNGYADIDTGGYLAASSQFSNGVHQVFSYPKGSGKIAMYQSGFLWGAKVSGQIRVGGSTYSSGLQPGKILSPGVAENPNLLKNRIYRVRPDYQTADLSSEAANEGLSENEIRANYETDWNEWPATEGAPFADKNSNGTYEPGTDIPGVESAGQTLWFVCNDLDSNKTTALYGSAPMGIEMQVTVWGYAGPGSVGNMMFKRYLIINKSAASFDSMYIAQWGDPDIGDDRNDFAGCDSALSLGYVYNSTPSDAFYSPLPPPALGFALLQGPAVPSTGETAHSLGAVINDFRNLPMTAFSWFGRGDATVVDPLFGTYANGTLRWYNDLQGLIGVTGTPFIDPVSGSPTGFVNSGDPISGHGWIDGMILPSGTRRIFVASGPFQVAPGDSQDVLYAVMTAGAKDVDWLTAVSDLKEQVYTARSLNAAWFGSLPPAASAAVEYPTAADARISITADGGSVNAQSIIASLIHSDGTPVAQLQLFDDGAHGDGGAGDGIFANTATVTREKAAIAVTLDVADNLGGAYTWERELSGIVAAGPLTLGSPTLFSDNINSDGVINPGENIRYGVTVLNASGFALSGLRVFPIVEQDGKVHAIDSLADGAAESMTYSSMDAASFFSVNIPSSAPPSQYDVPVLIADASGNRWVDTIQFQIAPFTDTVKTEGIAHLTGDATGSFSVAVIDPSQVMNHLYVIHGVDSINSAGDRGFTLKDSTDGRILLLDQPIPDTLGHDAPVVDGFKVLRGTIDLAYGWKDWSIPSGERRWTWDNANDFLEGFNGAIGNPSVRFVSGTTLGVADLHSVLIAFAATNTDGDLLDASDTTASFAYRYVRNASLAPAQPQFAPFIVNATGGYAYQDYNHKAPFAAYDITASRRLMVGYLENNVTAGLVDGKYWPPEYHTDNVDGSSPREWFFIFDIPYSETPDPSLEVDLQNNTVPMMWMGTPTRTGDVAFQAGDQFLIRTMRPVTAGDIYTFNPNIILDVQGGSLPSTFALYQNYPNPFNPTTTITYTLPAMSRVVLKIYNILGQEVKTLVDAIEPAGERAVVWNGTTNQERMASSGVYFYRLKAGNFVDVKKLVFLR